MIKNITIQRIRLLTAACLLLAAFMFPTGLHAQGITVSGIVKDEKGELLPGVVIRVKGTSTGTTSGAGGKYAINTGIDNATLIFSFIGYATREVAVGGRSNVDVTLASSEKSLEQVVVVGYGTIRKSDITGSISSVSSKEIKAVPAASLSQALEGRAAGVKVSQASNAPGGGMTIRIRGGNSIQGGNEPLYVVDGYPLYNESGPAINPNDIESMEILKDASATAIYGSRGANGVIIIQTKRGRSGRNNIQFESYYGMQTVRKKLDLLNATELATLVNEGVKNVNADNPTAPPRPLPFTDAQIAALGEGTDWQDAIFQDAPIQNYQLTFSGGNDKTQYAVSGNYFDQQGIVINSGFGRGSVRLNLDQEINSRFKLSTSLTVTRSKGKSVNTDGDGGAGAGVVYGALNFSPTVPIFQADGKTYTVNNRPGGILISNPVAMANETRNNATGTRLLGNISGEYKIIEGLVFKALLGANLNYNKTNFYLPRTVYSGLANNGSANIYSSQYGEWLSENTLSYRKTFNKIHKLNVLAGYTFQMANFEDVRASAQNFSNDILIYNNLGTAQQTNTGSSNKNDWALRSYIGRINYDLKEKYLLTLTGRIDGSSRFGEGNKSAFFPSGSVAWRVSNESFMHNVKAVSDLKIRASYGLTGNQEIGQYQSLGGLQTQNYSFGNVLTVGYAPNRIGNPRLKWETTTQVDIGLDFALFNNRIQVTADWYQKKTKDLLYNVSLPITSGYFTSLQNIGKVKNQGTELAINSTNLTGEFQWNTSFNISYNKNEILDLGAVTGDIPSGGASGHLQLGNSGILRVGQPIGVFFGLVTDGIFQNAEEIAKSAQKSAKPGDRRYKDINPDGVINSSDRVILGHAQPDYTFGFTNNFSFKGFDLSIFFQGVEGNSIFNLNRFELESQTGVSNQLASVKDRWTPANPSQTIPRASANGQPYQVTSRQVEDGSYIRLRNIQLGYNFPSSLLKRAGLTNVKIYVSAQNLLTFTDYSGFDPEVSRFGQENLSQGTDYGSYPASKIFLVGVNIGL
ncbi:SusC/RagA family TonB-linked outer membrane protein [Chitinophaga niabensis]|uniref:TonB-linked outer membrane protein, SusC/RagA family n=1 Tax=Chitinophaga niabensis TaxID=536979 RepID=A0A1N6K6W1_9BACT|nr:TonB-dependent receptor [Chitinophaga niabensis]SIO52308.1 TonB-linked outer membrane protein, SusC/RagA family [Chitinophaga niabensis]